MHKYLLTKGYGIRELSPVGYAEALDLGKTRVFRSLRVKVIAQKSNINIMDFIWIFGQSPPTPHIDRMTIPCPNQISSKILE
jgi:hypothetical protein